MATVVSLENHKNKAKYIGEIQEVVDLNEKICKERSKDIPLIHSYPTTFLNITETTNQAIFLSRVVYWFNEMKGEFYKSLDSWVLDTGMSEYMVRLCYKELKQFGYISYKKRYVNKMGRFLFKLNTKEVILAMEYYRLKREKPPQLAKNQNATCQHELNATGQHELNAACRIRSIKRQESTIKKVNNNKIFSKEKNDSSKQSPKII